MSLITHGKDEIKEHFDTLEKQYLANNNKTYLLNENLSMADVYVAITISSLEPLHFDFSPWPGLCRWFEKVKSEIDKVSHKSKLTKLMIRPR